MNQKIEKYQSGRIKINNITYIKDVIVGENCVFSPWVRKKSHNIQLKELERALEMNPVILVIGTGTGGGMKVSKSLIKSITDKGVKVVVKTTSKAVKVYNKYVNDDKVVVGAFHLTC